MFQYLLKRLLAMIPTLLGITFVTFSIINCAPGDPVAAAMGKSGAEGGGTGGETGGSGEDNKVDAIKTKKKLLGMLEEDRVVRVWAVAGLASEPLVARVRDRSRPNDLEATASLGDFPKFARTLSWSAATERLFVGSEAGNIHVLDAAGAELARFSTVPRAAAADGAPSAGSGAGADAAPSAGALSAFDVWSTAVDAAGTSLAVGDGRGGFRVLDAATGEPRAPTLEYGLPVRTIATRPAGGGATFLSGCDDGVIREHDGRTGAVVRELAGHTAFVGALVVAGDGSRMWSGGYDRKLREWDLASGKVARIVGETGQSISGLALSPDGRQLAAACEDRFVYVFDLAAGAGAAPRRFQGHSKGVTAVTFTHDGAQVASGGRDGVLRVFDAASGLQLAATPEDQGEVRALLRSPDGAALWSASESHRKAPAWKRYLKWVQRTATFDFDRSLVTDEKVIDKITEVLPVTIGLNALALLLTYLVAVPWGILAAVRRGRTFDRVSSVILFLLWSMPSFWVATILIMTFSSKRTFDLFPSVGLHASNADQLAYLPWLADWAAHLVLPILVMTYGSFTGLTQYMRTSMLESISQDYVRTARAKGLSERIVVFKHALRNSLITMVTLLAGLLPGMIGGSLFVEIIFSIEGMGKLGYTAVLQRDYPIIMAITTFSAFLTLVGVLVSDLLYGIVDPRIRHE